MMNFDKHSSFIVSMNLSHLPFRLGLALGNALVLRPRLFFSLVREVLAELGSPGRA